MVVRVSGTLRVLPCRRARAGGVFAGDEGASDRLA